MSVHRDKTASLASNTVVPTGDIVGSSAFAVEQTALKMINEGETDIFIDLSGVEEIDTLGVQLLIALRNLMKSKQGNFKVVNPSEHLTQLFLKIDVYDFLNVHTQQTVSDSMAADVLPLPVGT